MSDDNDEYKDMPEPKPFTGTGPHDVATSLSYLTAIASGWAWHSSDCWCFTESGNADYPPDIDDVIWPGVSRDYLSVLASISQYTELTGLTDLVAVAAVAGSVTLSIQFASR